MGRAKIMSGGGGAYPKDLKDAQVITAVSVNTDTIKRGEYIENVTPDITLNEKVQTLTDISSQNGYSGFQSTCFLDDTRAIMMIIRYVGSSSYAVEVGALTLTKSENNISASFDGVVSIRTLTACYINPGNVRLENGNVVFMFGDYGNQYLVTVKMNSDNSIEIVEATTQIALYGSTNMFVINGNTYSVNLVNETTALVVVMGKTRPTDSEAAYACLLDIQNKQYKSNWTALYSFNDIPVRLPVYQINQDTFILVLFDKTASTGALHAKYSVIRINLDNILSVKNNYDTIISTNSKTSLDVLDPVVAVKDGIVYVAYSYAAIYSGERFYNGIEQMLKLNPDNTLTEIGKYPVTPSPITGSYSTKGNPVDVYQDVRVGNCICRAGLSFGSGMSYVNPAIGAYVLNKGLISFTKVCESNHNQPQLNGSKLSVNVNVLSDGNTLIIIYTNSRYVYVISIQVIPKIIRSGTLIGGVAKKDIPNEEPGQVLIL